jgi:protoheme IX farnesyltransferase
VSTQETYSLEKEISFMSKMADYVQFAKLRLSTLVVFSAAISYITVAPHVDWTRLLWLVLGGFLITASSNGFNQVIERDTDKLMARTANRPLPQGRMSVSEGILVASVFGLSGASILFLFINFLSGILGMLALLLYTLVYTPLKSKTPFAVFVGAFPGAIPPLLGCVAATAGMGSFTLQGWVLFFIQFIWQFPHFWAIAWVLDDDYKKAGFKMLPSPGGRDKSSAFQILIYTLFLLPISLTPVFFRMSGAVSAIIITICGLLFIYQAQKVFNQLTVKYAQNLMFGSFAYLPIVQLAIMFGK